MTLCDKCIHKDTCGEFDPAMTFCADRYVLEKDREASKNE